MNTKSRTDLKEHFKTGAEINQQKFSDLINSSLNLEDDPLSFDGGRVGIGTTSPSANLHISAGTTGDAILLLEADTDNAGNEDDNAMIQLRQDGGSIAANIGFDSPNFGENNFGIGGYAGDSPLEKAFIFNVANGNVGIGTTSPSAKLEVNGNIKIGGGTPITKIIAGRVNVDGSKVSGSGFSCNRISVGKYQITFDSAFSSIPLALVSGHTDSDQINTVINVTSNSMEVRSLDTWKGNPDLGSADGSFDDTSFSFIAIGL